MKTSMVAQKCCVQCELELNLFQRLKGDVYCSDLCHQQKSKDAIARVKAGFPGDPQTAARA
jgi:hypothetical protein